MAYGNLSKASENADVGTATTSAPELPALAVLLCSLHASGGPMMVSSPLLPSAHKLAITNKRPTAVSPGWRTQSSLRRWSPGRAGDTSTATWPAFTTKNASRGAPCSKTTSPGPKARTFKWERRNSKQSSSRSAMTRICLINSAGSIVTSPVGRGVPEKRDVCDGLVAIVGEGMPLTPMNFSVTVGERAFIDSREPMGLAETPASSSDSAPGSSSKMSANSAPASEYLRAVRASFKPCSQLKFM
mmetsp:Transcript_77104/g.194747  ORF Transcript_77104/g.194747 Transcript_77104/m.194747 type:complete len:244 (-) Transcript_77104:33-764(-)